MKKQSNILFLPGLVVGVYILLSTKFQDSYAGIPLHASLEITNDQLKEEALSILETKCNACHKKQNPFMVFKEKNMTKRAPRIYQQVFLESRMPKGDEIRLTNKEYNTLKKWLFTEKIF